nr:AAA family ATPase [Actinopolymorpha cephalotaxi]
MHRLTLRDFRGVATRDLDFDEAGVTVVLGDNETGKSSILEALSLLFELPDDSKAGKLKAVQPAGRDVSSEVAAELTLGGQRVHYRKRWFRQRLTELRVDPGGHTWTGREAHDEAARLFAAHVDGSLWAALVVGQEHALAVPAAGSVAAVLTALDESAGGEVDHGASVPLVAAVEREYQRYFTRTGRPSGDYAEAISRRDQERARVADSQALLAEVEQDVASAERLTRDRATMSARSREQEARVAELSDRRQSAEELVGQVDRLRRDAEFAAAQVESARAEAERRAALVEEVRERDRAATEAEDARLRTAAALRAAEQEWERATAALRVARDEQAARRAEVRRLDAHLSWLRDRADLARLRERLTAVEEAREQERRAAAALDRANVDEAALEAAETAHVDVLAARAALAAGAPTMVVRRLGDAGVELSGVPLEEATVEREVTVDRDTTVRVPDVVEVTVRPGTGAAELAAVAASAEDAERRLLAELGRPDIGAVRQAARSRVEAERALTVAREVLTRRLEGRSFADLSAAHDQLLARVADDEADDIAEDVPEDVAEDVADDETDGGSDDEHVGDGVDRAADAVATLFDPEPLPVRDSSAVKESLTVDEPTAVKQPLSARTPLPGTQESTREALGRAQAEDVAAAKVLAGAEATEAGVRTAFETARDEATEARVRAEQAAERRADAHATLDRARAQQGDELLTAAVDKAMQEAAAIAADLAEAEDAVSRSGAGELGERLAEATTLRAQLAEQVEHLQDELSRVEGALERAGAQGLATAADRARAELAHVEEHHATLERRALAAARLRETLERHRAQARLRYAAPLRDRIEALGRVVHGPSFAVSLGADLEVEARTVDGIRLPVSSLSTGAREQLATLVRLAIAGLTATDGSGVPVVLDDALGWSDPGRLQAMGALLARAGATGQVILLTSAPDRYVGTVPGARVVRI